MRKPRTSNAVAGGLLASIEDLQNERGRPPARRAMDLTDTILLLAERIADQVAARLAEDLLAMTEHDGRRERRRG
ncbi:MAG TPA: hypothetical protein VKY51_09625 [Fredinandcohnia sp.]|nr:hypothetical protein [Fredinandcohnia sp.]